MQTCIPFRELAMSFVLAGLFAMPKQGGMWLFKLEHPVVQDMWLFSGLLSQ